jgi:hypothetical protein
MKSTLLIKDLALDKELGGKVMSAIRGGISQSNVTYQANDQKMYAPVSVGNGSAFLGKGDVTFDVTSNPTMTASNDSSSANYNSKGWGGFPFFL